MMTMKSSAIAGALVAQLMYVAMELPTYQAAWGWSMPVPTNAKFTCTEGAAISATSAFACTVTPVAGYTCDTTSTKVVCSDSTQGFTDSVPSDATIKCLNVGHKPGKTDNDDTSTLSWKPVPACTDPSASGAQRNAGFATAATFAWATLV